MAKTKDEVILELRKELKELKDAISTPAVPETKSTETEEKKPFILDVLNAPEEPIPLDYRSLVDTLLNRHFGIKIVSKRDLPAFEFIVIVPEKYSTVTEGYKAVYKFDIRSKVITYAEGINGVRDWCEKVWKSFTPELQAQISMERV